MTPERWRKIEELFEFAVARPIEERAMFLDEACAGDDSLRREVEALLVSDRKEESAFEQIASEVAANWMTERDGHELVGQTLGRYQILAPLGSGGMGEVYLAQDTALDRKVALKLLPPQFTQNRDRLRRFEQEARAASALNHPNIITIYETGEWEGSRFIAAEYVEGETLGELIQKPERPLSALLEIGIQASGALVAAHSAGIVHRDIKPANIMLRTDGYIKVLDFGLAKLVSSKAQLDVTEPGRVLGTINYMSPEQAMGQPLDHRTDIFSLGVVLYEIATGRRLFAGNSEAAIYDCILHQPVPPMREFVPATPVELDHVIRHALEKDPGRRYQTAADFRADLKRLAQGSGETEAAKVAAVEQRAARRSRNLRAAAIAAVVVSVISAAVFLGGRFAAHDQGPNDPSRKSIAVLPFDNLSSDKENAYFADGVQDQVLTDLAKIAELKVISRTSVLEYKPGAPRNLREIGQQLGVAYLLEGSVQRAAGKVRVNAQLTNASTDAHLWAETYDSDLADVFAIQSDIARAIAKQLRARLSAVEKADIDRKPTSNLAAFDLYTRGKVLIDLSDSGENSEESLRAGIDFLNQAVQRDPTYIAAYCQLARAHDALYRSGIDHTASRLAQAQNAVDAALRLSPDSGDTHLALAMHLYVKLEYDRAQQELAAARLTLPNNGNTFALSGYIHRRLGRWPESTRDLEHAVELDPRNVDILQQLASNYESLKSYAADAGVLERIIALRPDRLGPRLARASVDLFWRADTQPLRALIDARLKENPADAKTLVEYQLAVAFFDRDLAGIANALAALGDRRFGNDSAHFSRAFGEGLLARMKGDTAAAHDFFAADRVTQERIVRGQPDYGPAVSMLGLIDAVLGRKEEALREGRRGIELLPVARDSMNGPAMITNLALIAAWTGETDLAIEQLRITTQRPPGPHYGTLKLDPMWDPLRGDSRFEKIVASLAPTGAR
jgi:eukaryotic-like serine/threonine-protein kinase